MPWCHPRVAPMIYFLTSYAFYLLLIYPTVELFTWLLRTFTDLDVGHQSEFSRILYLACLLTFAPCYVALYYWHWKKHGAKPLFVPKWKTSNTLEEDDVICTICYELIVDPHTLRCQHSFCKKCIDQCLPLTRRCPSCQQLVYWSSRNRAYNSKVLKWVIDNGKEAEYDEVVKLKAQVRPVKVGCCTRFGPLLFPFLEEAHRPRRNRNRNRRRNRNRENNRIRPIENAAVEMIPLPQMNVDRSARNVDGQILHHVPLVIPKPLSVIIEVPEDVLQDSTSAQLSAAPSSQSIYSLPV